MAESRRDGRDARVVGGMALIGVLVLAGIVVLLVRGGATTDPDDEELMATPITSATTADPTDAPQTEPEDTPTEDPDGPGEPSPTTPTESGTDPGAPTDADAVAAAEAMRPSEATISEVVVADLDGDSTNEVIVASLVAGRTRIDVARWDGTAYLPIYSGDGGAADAMVEVRVDNLTDRPETREILVRQTSGEQGESVSLWGIRDAEVVPLDAVDGCWHGSHTYGIVGAQVEVQRITATCDGSPDPLVAWPSDVYVWDGVLEAFAYERTVQP